MWISRLVFAFCLVGCFSASAISEPLRVGVIVPLSGPAADYGLGIQRAIELATIDNPERSTEVEFIFEDVAHDPARAVQAFHMLRNVHKVDLVYTFGVSFCKALAPLAEGTRLPTVGQCIDPEAGRGKRFFIRFQNYTDEYMREQLDNLQRKGVSRLGILVSDHSYPEALLEALQRSLRPEQRIVSVERISMHEQDLRSALLKVRNSGADVIGALLYAGQHGPLGKQARALRIDHRMFGSNLLEGLSELENVAGSLDGTTVVGHPVSEYFEARYTDRFGPLTQPSFSALAYTFALTLYDAAQRRSLDGGDILTVLFETAVPAVATGPCAWADEQIAGRYLRCRLEVKEIRGTSWIQAEKNTYQ